MFFQTSKKMIDAKETEAELQHPVYACVFRIPLLFKGVSIAQ
jgi:hypothetical protein